LDHELIEQLSHSLVDELAAVVGMEAANDERKLGQHRGQYRLRIGGQQLDVGAGVALWEAMAMAALHPSLPGGHIAPHQASHLRPAEPRHFAH